MSKREMMAISIAVLILCLLAPLKLDTGWVPITLQTLVIFTLAGLLPWRLAGIAVLLYLLLGALGLPIYGGYTSGWEKLNGPTAGFLWGFLPVSLLVSYETERKSLHFFNAILTMGFAHFVLLVPGFLVLYYSLEGVQLWPTFVRLLPGLMVKSILAGVLVAWLKPKLPPLGAGVEVK